MNSDAAYELIKICLTEAFIVAAPIIGLCLVVGVAVSLFQTITTIQEQTLTFVPKVFAVGAALWLLSPWILQKMGNLTILFFQRIGDVAR